MAAYPHGSTELTCRALLEHPRRVRHSHIAVVFDAVLKGTGIANGNPLLFCSFRYVKKKAGESTEAGVYDITVRVSHKLLFSFAVDEQIYQRLQVTKLQCTNRVLHVSPKISR